MREPLEIVDEQDQVIGTAERSDIHAQGLLHREVHVFVTDGTRIALQRRSAGALERDLGRGILMRLLAGMLSSVSHMSQQRFMKHVKNSGSYLLKQI